MNARGTLALVNIQGKAAIITGGASGLGAATARAIQKAGGKPVLVDRDAEKGAALANELGGLFVAADVSDARAIQEAVDIAIEEYGALHAAISCAGIAIAERVLTKEGPADLESFSKVIRVNLIGTYNVVRLASAAMSKNEPNTEGERGVLINTASIAAYDGQIGQSAYSASKAGIAGMTLPLARDLSRNGIRVMTIAPGLMDTPLLAGLPGQVRNELGASVPFPSRLGRPDEFAQLAMHILENVLLNGEVIRLDGALRMPPR
jgi:NAD(P)-dependent dehydrogenase (short-subunit alcohol dehydrogenase family)